MKESPRKLIKLNQMKPSTLNRTQMSLQSPAVRLPFSVSTKYNREPSISFSTQKTETGQSKNQSFQPRNFQNRTPESSRPKKDKVFKFELTCLDTRCDDDAHTLASNGGYSLKSLGKMNEGVHNHRKIGQSTEYEYAEDEVPEIIGDHYNVNPQKEPQKNEESQKRFPYPKLGKVSWRISPFAPIFGNKHPQLQSTNLQRYIDNEQNRQKKQLQKYELELEIDLEKKKQRQAKKKFFKTDAFLLQKEKGSANKLDEFLDSVGKNMKTRLQQKQQALSGFEVSNKAEPGNQGRFCYPCKVKFDDYWEHIQLADHKLKLRKCFGTDLFLEEIQNMEDKNKEEMSSEEYRYFLELNKYLERIIGSFQEILTKKNILLGQKLQDIKDQLDCWIRY